MSFPRYPEYKESGIEWLGEVPAHWDIKRLKNTCHVFPSNVDKKSYEGQLPILLCNYTDVYYNEKVVQNMNFMDATASNDQIEKFSLKAGDTIVTKDSESADDIAISAYVPEDLSGVICGYHLSIVRPKFNVCGAFVKRLFDSKYVRSRFAVAANGLTRYGLTQYALDNTEMPWPPSHEQVAIAAFLDQETSKIDALVAEQEKLIVLLKEKRQAVISHAVTKGLNPDVPMKDSGIEWLGKVPAHWKLIALKRVSSISYGIGEPPTYQNGGTPLIRATNISNGTLSSVGLVFVDPSDIPEKRIFWLEPGDIIVVRSGAYTGDSAIIPRSYGPCIAGFDMIVRCHHAEPEFVQFALLSKYLKEGQIDLMRMRAAQPHLNAEELGQTFLALPPRNEQITIASYLNLETVKLDELVAEAETAINLLKERRAALISAAVTGKIDVRGMA